MANPVNSLTHCLVKDINAFTTKAEPGVILPNIVNPLGATINEPLVQEGIAKGVNYQETANLSYFAPSGMSYNQFVNTPENYGYVAGTVFMIRNLYFYIKIPTTNANVVTFDFTLQTGTGNALFNRSNWPFTVAGATNQYRVGLLEFTNLNLVVGTVPDTFFWLVNVPMAVPSNVGGTVSMNMQLYPLPPYYFAY